MKWIFPVFLIPVLGLGAIQSVALYPTRNVQVEIDPTAKPIVAKVSFDGIKSLDTETNRLLNSEKSFFYAIESLKNVLKIPNGAPFEVQGLRLSEFRLGAGNRVFSVVLMDGFSTENSKSPERSSFDDGHTKTKNPPSPKNPSRRGSLLEAHSDWLQTIRALTGIYLSNAESFGKETSPDVNAIFEKISDIVDKATIAFDEIAKEVNTDPRLLSGEREELLVAIQVEKNNLVEKSKLQLEQLSNRQP